MRGRILFISHVGVLGGAELTLLDLLHSLDRQSYDVQVVLPGPGDLAERLGAMGIPVDFCPGLGRLHRSKSPAETLRQAASLIRGAHGLARIVRRVRPDIVHANSTTSALYALCLPWRPRLPVLWHLRDMSRPGRIERWLAHRAERVIVPSLATRELIRRAAVPEKVLLVPNGVASPTCRSSRESSRKRFRVDDGPLGVVIAQLVPWKGHGLVLRAAELARARNPAVRLLVVGGDLHGDDPRADESLKEAIARRGLAETVRLLGHRTDVGEILAAADFLIHPAFPEPFGRVVVEAMLAGRPVVALKGEHGPAEILRGGLDGLLVSRTPEALADAIVSLAESPLMRFEIASGARRRAETCYSPELMARRTEEVYDAVLGGAPGHGWRPAA